MKLKPKDFRVPGLIMIVVSVALTGPVGRAVMNTGFIFIAISFILGDGDDEDSENNSKK
jgi:energy-converting hydrogenase Eha subunit G